MTKNKFDLKKFSKCQERLLRNGGKISNSEKVVYVKHGSGIKVWGAAEGVARYFNYRILKY